MMIGEPVDGPVGRCWGVGEESVARLAQDIAVTDGAQIASDHAPVRIRGIGAPAWRWDWGSRRLVPDIVDEHCHGSLLGQGFSGDFVVDIDVAIQNLDPFSRERDNAFDGHFVGMSGTEKSGQFPSLGPTEPEGEAIEPEAVALAIGQ